MKAFVIKQNENGSSLVAATITTPEIKADEVLIETRAIGINPVEAYLIKNADFRKQIMQLNGAETEIIPGGDVAGIVQATGSAVTKFRAGDAVFGGINFPGKGGAFAEQVAAKESQLALKPEAVSFEEAAATTLAALTAYQSLVTYAKVKAGDKVVIQAAAGGVGHYAIQIAKHLGATVIAIASAANKDFVLGLGADEFIDYKTVEPGSIVNDATVVLDAVSFNDEQVQQSLNLLKDEGRLVTLLAFFSDTSNSKMSERNIYGHRLSVQSNGEDMQVLADWLELGVLKPFISERFSFDELPETIRQIETGRTRGKIVVNV